MRCFMKMLCHIARVPLSLTMSFCMIILAAGGAAAANNPCSLLTAAEVEAILGAPLAGPPFRVDGYQPSAEGPACRYETTAFRAITVEVDWEHGGDAFAMFGLVSGVAEAGGLKGVLTLTDGTEFKGSWDEAQLFLCCQFNALRGDQRVMVDISATKLTEKDAAVLADKAVQRLDHPLDVADGMGIAEAMVRDKSRPAVTSACSLIARNEAEALVGAPLLTDPEGNENMCSYVWTPTGADYQMEIKLSVTWRGGLGEMRMIETAVGLGLGMFADLGPDLAENETAADPLFDDYSTSILGVLAVRKDVLLSIESGPDSELAARFVAVAAAKL